jgi:tetratricopeptide (TPR) repeat protein
MKLLVICSFFLTLIPFLISRENPVKKAQQSLDLLDYEQAILYFKMAIKENPSQMDLRQGLGFAHFRQQEFEAAIAILREEIQLFPQNFDAMGLLGYIFCSQNRLEDAAKVCLEIEENFQKALLVEQRRIGRNIQLKGENLVRFQRKLQNDFPNFGLPYFINGLYFREKANYPEAERNFSLALERGYDPMGSYMQLINTELLQENWEQALDVAAVAINSGLNPAEFYFLMGYAYYQRGQVQSSLSCFLNAYKLKPYLTEALKNLAKIHYNRGEIPQAHAYLLRVLKLDPYDFEMRFLLERTQKGISIIQEELKPQITKKLVDKAELNYVYTFNSNINMAAKIINETSMTLLKMGRIREAAQMIADFLFLSDLSPDLNYNLAQMYNTLDNLNKALEFACRAAERMEDFKDATDLIGNILFKLKDFEGSLDYYRKVLAIDPKDAMGYYNLGCVYSAMKDWDSAETSWKSAIENEKDTRKGKRDDLVKEQFSDIELDVALTVTNRPISFETHKALGFLYLEKKNNADALASFKRAMELDPSDSEPYFEVGRIQMELGNFQEAVTYLERYLYLGGQKEKEVKEMLDKIKRRPAFIFSTWPAMRQSRPPPPQ